MKRVLSHKHTHKHDFAGEFHLAIKKQKNIQMKYISIISLFIVLLFTGCMKSEDIVVNVIPDQPNIEEVTVGVMSNGGLLDAFPITLNEIDPTNHTAKIYVKTYKPLSSIWVSVRLEAGCKISPLEGAPKFGAIGDFSKPGKYEVKAASGASAIWSLTIAQDPNMPDISCPANFWTGAGVKCLDVPFPDYSPSTVTTEKIDCNHLKITVDFWQDPNAIITLDLQLGDPDQNTVKGSVTLLKDVQFNSWGYDMSYSKGPAGTYDLNTGELNFDPAFLGYQSMTSYPLTFSKN